MNANDPNGCLHVRDRLAEYALSGLAPGERGSVEAHLEWCAGCRKEAAELLAASTGLGRALDPVDPPRALEDRVVRSVRRTARRGGAHREHRRWVSAVASVAAVLVAALAISYASVVTGRLNDAQTKIQREEQAREEAEARAQTIAERLEDVLRELRVLADTGSELRQIQLAPASAGLRGGGAVVLVDNATQHFAVILLGGMPVEAGPYRVALLSPAGQVVGVTIGDLDPQGGIERVVDSAESLRGVRRVVVRDRAGHRVLTGSLIVVEASPNA